MELKKMTLKELAKKTYHTINYNHYKFGHDKDYSNNVIEATISELEFTGWKQFSKVTENNFSRFCQMVRKNA